MTWLEHHKVSEARAAEAEVALRSGNRSLSERLYALAAESEVLALAELDATKPRTTGISVVSAVSLFIKASRIESAENVAYRWLASSALPPFAVDQIRGLLQSIWSEQVRKRADVRFAPGQIMVSVKGGEIVEGGAPLDLIIEKVQVIQSLFYRTAEVLRNLPYRRHGPPTRDIHESCRPWLFQALPGSYQFAVAVQAVTQPDLFKGTDPTTSEVAEHFLRIVQAGVEDPNEGLAELVPDDDYRSTFLKLTRNLAPSGTVFDELQVRSGDERHAITLRPDTRKAVNEAIRKSRPALSEIHKPGKLRGVLRAVHLDKDWIEVTVDDQHLRVEGVGEAVDDVIGLMVNKRVIVEVIVYENGKYGYRDIEPDD